MNKFPASLRSDFSDCRFASDQVPLCFGIGADFIGILNKRDRDLLNRHADALNAEVEDALRYQAEL